MLFHSILFSIVTPDHEILWFFFKFRNKSQTQLAIVETGHKCNNFKDKLQSNGNTPLRVLKKKNIDEVICSQVVQVAVDLE